MGLVLKQLVDLIFGFLHLCFDVFYRLRICLYLRDPLVINDCIFRILLRKSTAILHLTGSRWNDILFLYSAFRQHIRCNQHNNIIARNIGFVIYQCTRCGRTGSGAKNAGGYAHY